MRHKKFNTYYINIFSHECTTLNSERPIKGWVALASWGYDCKKCLNINGTSSVVHVLTLAANITHFIGLILNI